MATTQSLIDDDLLFREGLRVGDLKARRRFKKHLQRALDYLWNLREFSWSIFRAVPTVVVAGGRCYLDVAAGEAFLRLGPHGVVTVDGRELTWIPKLEMERNYLISPVSPGTPRVYTDPEITGAGTPSSVAIFVYPPFDSASGHVAALSYKFRSPRLKDAGDSPPETGDELNIFPEQWHEPLLYELAGLYAMLNKSNVQAIAVQRGIVDQNLRNFLANERTGSSATHVMTPFVPPGLRRAYR